MHAHTRMVTYTCLRVPQTNRGKGTHVYERLGAVSPLPSPTSKAPSSLQCHHAVLLPHAGSGLVEGMARRARSQGRFRLGRVLRAHGDFTCFSLSREALARVGKRWEGEGCFSPRPGAGRSPIPNSPSGWKLLDPRNGEHMMSGVGAGKGQREPLCASPAAGRRAGP